MQNEYCEIGADTAEHGQRFANSIDETFWQNVANFDNIWPCEVCDRAAAESRAEVHRPGRGGRQEGGRPLEWTRIAESGRQAERSC